MDYDLELRLKKIDDELRENNRIQSRDNRRILKEVNHPLQMWLDVKSRARELKLPFDLEPSDIVIPERCPVLGFKFDDSIRNMKPSIDRIKPHLGYVKGNIAVISMQANRIKNNATLEELEAIVEYLKSKT